MRMTDRGPELVAVMSASARDRRGADLSMAVALEGPFAELLDMHERGRGAFVRGGGVTLTVPDADGGRGRLGARFVRP